MNKRNFETLVLLFFVALILSSCGWVKGLRKEIDEEYPVPEAPTAADYDYYKLPSSRNVPLPPASVIDGRTAPVAGTPIDYSGIRAKASRVTVESFNDAAAKNENSLWAEDGQNNYLFARNKLHAPGDLLTVIVEDGLRRDMVNSVKTLLPPELRDQEVRVPGLTKESVAAATPDGQPAAAGAAGTEQARAPASSGGLSSEDMMTAEVLERYPNGNLRLRGIKRIPFKNQVRNIEVVSIVKGADVGEDDTVKSSKFYEQHVELYK